jgi:deazaflavin-dependent oxidoreductase (nitroreductase family)
MPYRAAGHYRQPPVLHRLLGSAVAALAAHGFSPANTVALEVVGRRSGRLRRTAVVVVEHHGQRFVVSLGGESEWVRNVRGKAILRRGKPTPVRLVEVLAAERPPVLLAYASHRAFSRSPAYIARNYFGVQPHPGLSDFTDIPERYPVFVVAPAETRAAQGQRLRSCPWQTSAKEAEVITWLGG